MPSGCIHLYFAGVAGFVTRLRWPGYCGCSIRVAGCGWFGRTDLLHILRRTSQGYSNLAFVRPFPGQGDLSHGRGSLIVAFGIRLGRGSYRQECSSSWPAAEIGGWPDLERHLAFASDRQVAVASMLRLVCTRQKRLSWRRFLPLTSSCWNGVLSWRLKAPRPACGASFRFECFLERCRQWRLWESWEPRSR